MNCELQQKPVDAIQVKSMQIQICHFLRLVIRIHLRTAAVGDRFSVIKLPLWETNINNLQKDGIYKITNLLSSNYKGQQLYTTNDTIFSEIEMFVNVIEDVCSLINIRTCAGRVNSCKLVVQLKCMCCQKRFENADLSPIIKCMNYQQ